MPVFADAQEVGCPPNDAQIYFETVNAYLESQGREALAWNDALARAAESVAIRNREQGSLRKEALNDFLSEDEYDVSRADISTTIGSNDIARAFQANLPTYKKFLTSYPFREMGAACVDGIDGRGPYRAIIVAIKKADLPDSVRRKCGPGFARAVLTYTNDYRRVLDLPVLSWNDQLAAAAQVQADYMAEIDNAQHEGPDGNHSPERAEAQGYEYQVIAENVASGQATPLDVVMEWRQSPGHDKNLRNPDVRDMGAACVDRAHTRHQIFWAQELGFER